MFIKMNIKIKIFIIFIFATTIFYSQTFELRPQVGHSGRITDFSISKDSKFLLTSAEDLTLKIWDLETGRLIKTFYNHANIPISALFSYDNSYFYSLGLDGLIVKYEIITLSELLKKTKDFSVAYSLYQTKDNKIFLSFKNWNNELEILNVEDENEKYIISEDIFKFSISFDGRKIVYINQDGKLYFKNLNEDEKFELALTSNFREFNLNFSQMSDKILLWKDRKCVVMDINNKNELGSITIDNSKIKKAEFVGEDKFIILLMENGEAAIYKFPSLAVSRKFSSKEAAYIDFKASPNQKYLLLLNSNNIIDQYDFTSGQYYLSFKGYFEKFKKIKISKNKKYIGILGENYGAVWDFKRGRDIYFIPFPDKNKFNDFALNENGEFFIAACSDYSVKVFNSDNAKLLKDIHFHSSQVKKISLSPLGNIGISSDENNVMILFDAMKTAQLNNLNPHISEIVALSFANNGMSVFSCSKDGEYKIYDNFKANLLFQGKIEDEIIDAYIPNSLPIALIFSSNNKVYAINLINGAVIKTFYGFENKITSIAISEKGIILAIADDKFALKIVDFNSGAVLKNIKAHEGRINSIEFYDDEFIVFTASSDGLIKLWNYNTGDYLVALALMSDAKNFALVASDKRFEASSEAASRLHYVSGFKALSLESNRGQYFTPNLMRKILK